MDRSDERFAGLPAASAEPEIARVYQESRGLLLRLLERSYGVPAREAEALVYETIMALQAEGAVADPEAWLVAGVCAKGAAYQRTHGIAERPSLAIPAVDPAVVRDALALLSRRAREAVRLRYEERMTYPEIAAELEIPVYAAQRMVAKAVAQIRRIQRLRGRGSAP